MSYWKISRSKSNKKMSTDNVPMNPIGVCQFGHMTQKPVQDQRNHMIDKFGFIGTSLTVKVLGFYGMWSSENKGAQQAKHSGVATTRTMESWPSSKLKIQIWQIGKYGKEIVWKSLFIYFNYKEVLTYNICYRYSTLTFQTRWYQINIYVIKPLLSIK